MPARQAWRLPARGVLALAGLLDKTGGELAHLISDAATMQIIRWSLTLTLALTLTLTLTLTPPSP